MKCYYHNDRDAFGICSACGKGLCLECMDTSDNIIKCANNPKCYTRAQSINRIYEYNDKVIANTGFLFSKSHKLIRRILGILFIMFGLLLLLRVLFIQPNFLGLLFPLIGVFFGILLFKM